MRKKEITAVRKCEVERRVRQFLSEDQDTAHLPLMRVPAPSSSHILLLPAIFSAVSAFAPTPAPLCQTSGAGHILSSTVGGSGRGRICTRGGFQDKVRCSRVAKTMSVAAGIKLPPVICGQPPVGKRAIIFDIDGTLCDSSHMAMSATNKVLEEYGFPRVSPEEYHLGTRYTTPERLARHAGFSPGRPP